MEKRLTTRFLLPVLAALTLALGACNKSVDAPTPAAPVAPAGTTTLRMGTVVAQGGVMSGGTLDIVKAPDGTEHIRFNTGFHSDFHTGSLGIYLAKSDDLIRNQRAANPANVLRVGTITQSGAQSLLITGTATGFSHVILHCDAAQYNFGAAALK
ncbi:hypothetical protein [Hymenobacter antarcticus]|uniref:Electron transfer DM13 n=1 Tax=Hymenobacter antarcticus TaxID=486270 RepID=A0ABP7PCX3_9BACT